MRAGVKLGGADQIADVFEDQQVQTLGVVLRQSAGRHIRVDMAETPVVDLEGADPGPVGDALGVQTAFNVHVHLADVQAALQSVDEGDQRGGLPATGGGHDVQKQRALRGQPAADQFGLAAVFRKDGFVDLNDSHFAHFAFHSFTFRTRTSASACTPSPVFAEM